MGHTVSSQRMRVDYVLSELKSFGAAMCKEDRRIYQRMLKEPLKHVGAVSYASSLDVWAFVLLSILLEQEKRLQQLEKERVHAGVADGCLSQKQPNCPVDEDSRRRGLLPGV